MEWESPVGRALLKRLEAESLIWLTTVTPDGIPQSSLVWFWWSGDEILVFSLDGPRTRNIAGNPNVSLNFNSASDGNTVGIVNGVARIDETVPPVSRHDAYLAKYETLIVDLLDSTPARFAQTYSVPVLITPTSGRAW